MKRTPHLHLQQRLTTLGVSASLLALSACGRYHAPAVSPNVAPQFSERPTDGASPSSASQQGLWWERFGDPQLNQLIEGLMSQNLGLKQAQQRVNQLRAVATQVGSQRWPSLNLEGGWSRNKQLNQFSRVPNSPLPTSFTLDSYRASLAVSYELDLWGRLGSLTEAGERDAIAMEQDQHSMAVSLSATATDLWFQLAELKARVKLIEAQLSGDEELLALTVSRAEEGLAPHLQVLQQTQQRDRTRAQLPLLKAQQASLTRRLAALTGRASLEVESATELPELPPLPQVGVPAEALLRRPDVRAAQARLAAADARVSAALSARFPSLRLGASVGLQAFDPSELFDEFVWGLSANLLAPIFQAGRLSAAQAQQEAALKERLYGLQELLITAYHEIEDALSLERHTRAQLEELERVLESARELVETAQRRYLEGMSDFLSVLSARQGLYAAELAHLSARRALLSSRVQLHRALGGVWAAEPSSSALNEPSTEPSSAPSPSPSASQALITPTSLAQQPPLAQLAQAQTL